MGAEDSLYPPEHIKAMLTSIDGARADQARDREAAARHRARALEISGRRLVLEEIAHLCHASVHERALPNATWVRIAPLEFQFRHHSPRVEDVYLSDPLVWVGRLACKELKLGATWRFNLMLDGDLVVRGETIGGPMEAASIVASEVEKTAARLKDAHSNGHEHPPT